VEGSDDPDAALEDQEVILPTLKKGDKPTCENLESIDHQTQPPARYTEASLVKTLEGEGIGRPSTYASIIGTIIDRGYVQQQNNALIPTFTAFAVTALLENHFQDLVDVGFTARMEQTLDDISTGGTEWLPYLQKFYLGETGLETQVRDKEKQIDATTARTINLDGLDVKIKIGKFGAYIESEQGNASIPTDLTPSDLAPETIQLLLRQKSGELDVLGHHPETGEPIYTKLGPYGPYVQLGEKTEDGKKPKQSSLPKGVKMEDVTVEMAVSLLALPRLLGQHPETGCKIQAALGRFGPYVVHDQGKEGKDYRSIKAGDDVLTITLERALAMLAEPKVSRGSRGKAKEPLRQIGPHPADNEPVNIYAGPHGDYINHGKVNVSLPKEETIEGISLETAVQLLADKVPAKKRGGAAKSTTTKKKTTTKAKETTKEPAAKKTPAKKAAAKKSTTTSKKASASKP
jgi:DNA topoisomerase I